VVAAKGTPVSKVIPVCKGLPAIPALVFRAILGLLVLVVRKATRAQPAPRVWLETPDQPVQWAIRALPGRKAAKGIRVRQVRRGIRALAVLLAFRVTPEQPEVRVTPAHKDCLATLGLTGQAFRGIRVSKAQMAIQAQPGRKACRETPVQVSRAIRAARGQQETLALPVHKAIRARRAGHSRGRVRGR
jgi:hypothetical protein